MRQPVKLRPLTTEERSQIRRLTASRIQPFRLVQRARLIRLDDGSSGTVCLRSGKAGRLSQPDHGCFWGAPLQRGGSCRSARQEAQWSQTGAQPSSAQCFDEPGAAKEPDTLGYPFKLWTLEGLQRAFEEREGVHLSDSAIPNMTVG
ncbi:MAG: hypothetical protein KatS3mg023_2123 [Armatimonadota bacterium]|nr:MAG: hypothetical protein KatS3mg023_2123 [Armatimonadota bacterium]